MLCCLSAEVDVGKSFDRYRMPDELWNRMESLLPARPRTTRKGGRPRLQKLKPVADAIFYKMRTGCQWNALPRVFGASSTIHDYFQEWVDLSIFERMWELALSPSRSSALPQIYMVIVLIICLKNVLR